MSIEFPDWTKTVAFREAPNNAGTFDRLNQGQACAVALCEGDKSFEIFVRNVGTSTDTGTLDDYDIDALAVAPAIGCATWRWNGGGPGRRCGLPNRRGRGARPIYQHHAPPGEGVRAPPGRLPLRHR